MVLNNIREAIGNTPLLKIPSLSKICSSNIYIKCEHLNPGGSIKDRAALQMILDAIESAKLKQGMTIIEGTAGNTGIGLSLVGSSLGFNVEIVMPNNQAKAKEKMIELFGGKLSLVPPCPFKNENHFYHQAKNKAAQNPENYWWADQFENLSNFKAHYTNTGPELFKQLPDIDYLVSTAGSGGTIGGVSRFLKEKNPNIKVVLVDPKGSGLKSYFETGNFESEGDSFTEGIGIMRLVNNFKEAKIDHAISISDQLLVSIAHYVRKHDGIILGLSTALNVAGAFWTALNEAQNKNIVTFSCDLGERSSEKLYNDDFLKSKSISLNNLNSKELLALMKSELA